jgi:hypothetical protein
MITRDFVQIESYIAGWLTAYNAFTEDTNNIIPNGLDGATLWINNYCTNNPLSDLDHALQELVTEAYPSRARSR